MSDVPITGFPDPIGSSPSEARREANSTSSAGATRVGGVVGGAVAGEASARSSASEVLNSTAEGVKSLGTVVDKFVSGTGKKFSTTLEETVSLLERARAAADGLGGALGSAAGSMMDWATGAKESAKDAHERTKPIRHIEGSQQSLPFGASASAAGEMVNGGANSITRRANQDFVIQANNVEVRGSGGDSVGGSGDTAGNAGDKPNGGFVRRTAVFGGLLAAGAAARGAGTMFNDVASNLRPQQTAFSRGGFGSIPDQQRMISAYTDSGISAFGQEDLTSALNIGFGNLGGTNFQMANLAALQRASLDMSATQAAEVSQGIMSPQVRNRLYQYGINTRGMSPDEMLMQAARFSVGKRDQQPLTEADYNRLSTIGETGFQNLQYLTGGNEPVMQAARDLVGQQIGITGLDEANPTLQSEVQRDTARAEMNNQMLDNIATLAELRNATLTMLFNATSESNDALQDIAAGVGALSGPLQGLLGSAGASLLGGAGGAAGAGAASRAAAAIRGSSAAAAGSRAAAGVGAAGAVVTGLSMTGVALETYRMSDRLAGEISRGETMNAAALNEPIRDAVMGSRMSGQYSINPLQGAGALGGWDPNSPGAASLFDSLPEDVGDPPTGSAIRTSKPTSHVSGLSPRLRSALERMFRDNPRLRLNSGYRSIEHQTRLWKQALAKYGDPEVADDWVARPGGSKHNSGMAADIGPSSEYGWIAQNASRYGLYLPMGHEPWHVEPVGSRSGKEQVDINIASGGLASRGDSAGTPDTRRMAKFSSVNIGEVTSSEGSLFAGLLGTVSFGGDGPAPAPDRNVRNPRDVMGDDAGSLAGAAGDPWSGQHSGNKSFSGTMAERAEAVAYYAKMAGFSGGALQMAVAIALGESGGDPRATGDVSLQTAKWGPSLGLFQNRTLKNPERWSGLDARRDATKMYDPMYNSQFAYDLYRSKGGFGDWSVYTSGAYQQYMDEAAHGIAQIGDPATPGAGIDGAPRGGGGSVVMHGGDKRVIMNITGQQNPEELASRVMRILSDEEDFEMVGQS